VVAGAPDRGGIAHMDDWTLAVTAAAVLGFAAFSGRLERSLVTPAMVFVTVGLLVGDDALGLVDLPPGNSLVQGLAEATLALVLFNDASRIDLRALAREYAVPVRLLGIGLPLTVVFGALVAVPLYDGLSVAEALVLATVLAPTDAALGQTVVTDERIPSRVREGLNVESGLNDGICVPLLLIFLAVAETGSDAISASSAVRIVAEEIGYGLLGGVFAGVVGATVVRFAGDRGFIDPRWRQIVAMASAALAYGVAAALGGSGFIAAYLGGICFGLIIRAHDHVRRFVAETGELLNALTFFVFGAVFLGSVLDQLSWEAFAYAALSLTIVRMGPVAASMVGSRARTPTIAFLGWFGPRGLASIVFAVTVVEQSDLPHESEILLAAFAAVVLSVFAHGLSARPLTNRYVAWYEAQPGAAMERVPAAEHHWRWVPRR
jgi:NhaP-type Na+/H+ or K+/H+ antiporter